MPAQLVCTDVSFSYGPRTVLDGVTLTVAPGDRLGVVGPNGTGKSTLLGLMAGRLTPERGTVTTSPGDATVGLLAQQLDDRPDETVAALLARRTGVADAVTEFEHATAGLAGGPSPDGTPAGTPDPADRYDRALHRYLAVDAPTFDERLAATLVDVGLGGLDPHHHLARLSGGQRNRVNLAAVLLAAHDVLLLDEPTNDLDLDGLGLLEAALDRFAGTVVLVTHDRRLHETFRATRWWTVDAGQLTEHDRSPVA